MICPNCNGARGETIRSLTGREPDFFDACDECEGTGEVPDAERAIVCSICWEQHIISRIRVEPIEPKRTAGMDYLAEVMGARHVQATAQYICELGHVCGFISDHGELDIGITHDPDR